MLAKLADLGFGNAEDLGTSGGSTLLRIRTNKGWVYERFRTEAEVDVWAKSHSPEA